MKIDDLTLWRKEVEWRNRLWRHSLNGPRLAKLSRIWQIRQFMQMGGCIEQSPLYDDYLKLVDESGGMYFVFDDNVGRDVNMTKEEVKI